MSLSLYQDQINISSIFSRSSEANGLEFLELFSLFYIHSDIFNAFTSPTTLCVSIIEKQFNKYSKYDIIYFGNARFKIFNPL